MAARQKPAALKELTDCSRVQPAGPPLQLVHCIEQIQQGAPCGRLLAQHPVQIRPQQLAEHPATGPNHISCLHDDAAAALSRLCKLASTVHVLIGLFGLSDHAQCDLT